MRNFIHVGLLMAAATSWLLGVFLSFHQPLLGFSGTCGTLIFLGLALKADDDLRKAKRHKPTG